jgi:hypothetical protein
MNDYRDPRIVGAWFVGLVSLVVYTMTMAPTVAFWDSGEFISTAYTLGVPHPPGAPTFVLLGRLFTLLPIPLGIAAKVNLISAVSSAFTALLLYGIILEILHLWDEGHGDWRGFSPVVQTMAAATGALAFAFSHSEWFNAVEAEVYGLSMTVTALCLWLAFRHVRGGGEPRRASLLLLIGYVLGIGAGNHLLALLTIPSILILLWYLDRKSLSRADVWIGAFLLFAVGYSVYIMLYVRSGLNPPIDMNNPETIYNFKQFIQRKQYGDQSMLGMMFQRRESWDYQINYQFLRYFKSQFILPFYALALVGAITNLFRDRRTFFANGALWLIMGFGLVIYLNMPDPQPRDRDYIFVGCYFATAIWIGTGMAGLAGLLREAFSRPLFAKGEGDEPAKPVVARVDWGPRLTAAAIGIVGAVLVVIQVGRFYHSHDRTGDYIPWDYGNNILQTCPPGSILFTNGDNDTYPLWYLQVVEGVRRDIRVVNLSLLNTPWYIKELRDRSPQAPIRLTDLEIDRDLGGFYVPADTSIAIAGASTRLRRGQVWRVQDSMVAHIVAQNQWQRPIYFAITVPVENQAGFTANCQLEGFAFRLVTDEAVAAGNPLRRPGEGPVEADVTFRNLTDKYQYRAILDEYVYKDENAENLLTNYGVVVATAAREFIETGREEEAGELIRWAYDYIPLNPPQKLIAAQYARQSGDTTFAQMLWHEIVDSEEALPQFQMSAYLGLIHSYALTGEHERAVSVLDNWLEMAPLDSTARGWRSELQQGRVPQALRLMGRDPGS